MVRLAQPPAPDGAINAINMLARQLAATAADALGQAGVPLTATTITALSKALSTTLEQVRTEREQAVRTARIERRAAWVEEQSLLNAEQATQRLGLTLHELETALTLGLIAPAEVPPDLLATSAHFTRESWRFYWPDITLTDEDRACIARETLLTRPQAAERLGVSVREFDQLRKEHNLSDVEQVSGQNGTSPKLYRTDAVLQLTSAMDLTQAQRRADD